MTSSMYVCICITCMQCCRGQTIALHLLEMKFQMVVSRMSVLETEPCKSIRYAKPLSHLCRPQETILNAAEK